MQHHHHSTSLHSGRKFIIFLIQANTHCSNVRSDGFSFFFLFFQVRNDVSFLLEWRNVSFIRQIPHGQPFVLISLAYILNLVDEEFHRENSINLLLQILFQKLMLKTNINIDCPYSTWVVNDILLPSFQPFERSFVEK